MFAQIHLSSADISAEPEHTKIPTTTRRPRRLPNMATLHPHLWAWEPPPCSVDLLWLPQLRPLHMLFPRPPVLFLSTWIDSGLASWLGSEVPF